MRIFPQTKLSKLFRIILKTDSTHRQKAILSGLNEFTKIINAINFKVEMQIDLPNRQIFDT